MAGASESSPRIVGPLAGINVVRLGRSKAGIFLCRLLEDQGAEVRVAPLSSAAGLFGMKGRGRIVINDLGRNAAVARELEFSALAPSAPELIYCSLVGFPDGGPAEGPDLLDGPIAAALGLSRAGGGESPRPECLPIPSFYGAILAAIYIGCALFKPSTHAQFIEVPLFSAALNVIGRDLISVDDEKYKDGVRDNPRIPIQSLYEAAGGGFLQSHGVYPNFIEALCRVAGHPEWIAEAVEGLTCFPNKGKVQEWRDRLSSLYKEKSAADWEQLINQASGAATHSRTHREWAAEEHPWKAGIFARDATTGNLRVGPAVLVERNAASSNDNCTPKTRPRRDVPVTNSPLPLAGIRVLDFCIVLAGPTCGRILAELGADVIKIDAPDREINSHAWLEVNRGKRTVVIDLKREGGRAVVRKLVDSADIVIENFRDGKMASFGLGPKTLLAERPDLICSSINAFDYGGPWSCRAGWEQNAQAATGMQWQRSEKGIPRQVPVPANDFSTGMLAAFGLVMALIRRQATGVGSYVRASLARTATFMQLEHFETAGKRAVDVVPACRTYRCIDGWISIWLSVGDREQMPREVESWTRTASDQSCEEALSTLRKLGVLAAVERRPRDLLSDPWMLEQGLLVRWTHPTVGPMVQACAHGTASDFRVTSGFPVREPGADSVSVLTEVGCEGEIDALLSNGSIHSRLPIFG